MKLKSILFLALAFIIGVAFNVYFDDYLTTSSTVLAWAFNWKKPFGDIGKAVSKGVSAVTGGLVNPKSWTIGDVGKAALAVGGTLATGGLGTGLLGAIGGMIPSVGGAISAVTGVIANVPGLSAITGAIGKVTDFLGNTKAVIQNLDTVINAPAGSKVEVKQADGTKKTVTVTKMEKAKAYLRKYWMWIVFPIGIAAIIWLIVRFRRSNSFKGKSFGVTKWKGFR